MEIIGTLSSTFDSTITKAAMNAIAASGLNSTTIMTVAVAAVASAALSSSTTNIHTITEFATELVSGQQLKDMQPQPGLVNEDKSEPESDELEKKIDSANEDIPASELGNDEDAKDDAKPDKLCKRDCKNNLGKVLLGGAAIVGVGAVGGVAGTALGLYGIGLSALGPVPGGLFAVNMGAGLTAGSIAATLQSAAMTGLAYTYGAISGATIGGACWTTSTIMSEPKDEPK